MRDDAAEPNADAGTFGPVLRRLRLAARMSQEELAQRARLSVVSISALERGRRRAPYRETIRLLGDALNLPDAARRELETAAKRPLRGERETGDEPPFTQPDRAAPPGGAARDNLPLARTRLIGRDADVTALVALLREHRLVTLTGAGGIGKTRTALGAGEALLALSPAGVWFVDLAPIAGGSFVADAVARALGVKEAPDRPLTGALLAYLNGRDAVLILDNCEHVIAATAALADELLYGCARVRILATSRERLRLSGEHVVRLPPLPVPERHELAPLNASDAAAYAAVALFAERAQAVDRNFVLDDETAPVIADVCRLLDGNALAIELAAARANVLTPAALLGRLDERFRILTRGERSASPRHQTIRALIDWSYGLLTLPEKRLFERLSIFAGGCRLPAAVAVYADDACDEFDVLDLLSSLVDKSLVVVADVAGREPRFALLETTRQFAYEQLAARGEVTVAARLHAAAYFDLAEHLEHEYDVASERDWFARVEPELDNWRAALAWALGARGDVVLGQRLAAVMSPIWNNFSPNEGRRWVQAARELVDEQTPASVAALIEYAALYIAKQFHEHDAAFALSMRLITVYQRLGDPYRVARAQHVAGDTLVCQGRVAEGEALLRSALGAARSLGNPRLTGLTLGEIAYASSLRGNIEAARTYIAEAIDIWRSIGSIRNAANATVVLAEAEFVAGNTERAAQLAESALRSLHGRPPFLAQALTNLAAYLVACDRLDDAREHACEALRIAREMQLDVSLAAALQRLAAVGALSAAGAGSHSLESEIAARLIGHVDARMSALGCFRDYTERQEYDRVLTSLRSTLGADRLAALMASGAGMTTDQALQHAVPLQAVRST